MMARNSKLFMMVAIFLVGMLVLGLLAIGGVVIFGSINRAQQAARPTPTPTLPAVVRAPTATQTSTPTVTPLPTNTPLPTLTYTPVVLPTPTPTSGGKVGGEVAGQSEAAATRTPVPAATPVEEETTPDTGIGGLEAVLIAAGLVGVLFITRRLRTSR
jgi:hypothetical protein